MTRPHVLTGEHFMHGDHACAEGALAAGCTFFAGYPITPSTEVAERLAWRLPEIGGTFIQMEDELASVAAIIGASAAGVRAMTATSGPGLSLMLENLGLAVMMEIPCVLVDIQRGSPSTGLPTMPGQSDIMQARWGSHGDFRIIAYCPWSPQELFDLTFLAFNMADRYRVPVLLLADEVIGHMVERVVIPAAEEIPFWPRKRPERPPNGPFEAFRGDDPDLVPPMAHAGDGYRVHFTGLTHDVLGYPVMTAAAHQRLVGRLTDKIQHNAADIVRCEAYDVADATVIVVAFGCTARSAQQAVSQAREQGIAAGLFRPISLWPFPERELKQIAGDSVSLIVAEMNLGQIALEVERLLRRPVSGLFHAGGAMIAPEMILKKIQEVACG